MTKTSLQKVYKNNKLNNANFNNFSHTDYKVFLYLISKLGGVDEVGKYLQPEQLEREHTLTALEFSEVFKSDIHNSYKFLKKSVDKLIKTDLLIAKNDSSDLWRINVCSMAKYNETKGYISIKFTDDIMPYLAQVRQKFILYNLKEIANFGSLYTTRLYELLQEFKDTGYLVKSIAQLRDAFATESKFARYNDFKRFTFNHACKEINKIYNLDLSFEEIKERRKVTAVKFSFNKTKIYKAVNPKTGKLMNRYEKPKPKSKDHSSNSSEVIEGQMAFDDLSKNLGKVVQGFADNLKQEKN